MFAILFEAVILQWEILVDCVLGHTIASLVLSDKSRCKDLFHELFSRRTQWFAMLSFVAAQWCSSKALRWFFHQKLLIASNVLSCNCVHWGINFFIMWVYFHLIRKLTLNLPPNCDPTGKVLQWNFNLTPLYWGTELRCLVGNL